MKTYYVWGTPVVPFKDLNYNDQWEYENITEGNVIDAEDEEDALDKFHETIPIKVLDDWEIDVTEVQSFK